VRIVAAIARRIRRHTLGPLPDDPARFTQLSCQLAINLSGRVALVTGASGELGRPIARTLGACGAKVAIHYHKPREAAHRLHVELADAGKPSCVVSGDVTDIVAVEQMRREIEASLGSVDIVVNNAVTWFEERPMFACWEEEVRPQIAAVRGIEFDDVRVDALGDLRLIRNSIIHEKGVLSSTDHAKLKKMASLLKPKEKITLTHDEMHKLFIAVKQAIAEIILSYTGDLPGAPDPSQIVDVAIQITRQRRT